MKENAKNVPLLKQNVMKLEVFIIGGQRIILIGRERRHGGEGSRERIEIERKKTRVNDLKRKIRNITTCLCLLFSFLSTAFVLSSHQDSAVKCCSSEVLLSTGATW